MRAAASNVRFAWPASRVAPPRLIRRPLQTLWARRRDPHLYLQLGLLGVCLSAIWLFALIVEDYLTRDPLVRWDVEFSRWLHVHSTPALVDIAKVVTLGGTVVALALLTVGVAFVLVRRGDGNEAAVLCAGALGIEIVNPILKLLFHRPRPELAYVHLDTYSFPSGHAAGSAAIYALVLYFIARRARMRWQAVAAAGYVAIVVSIGFSRLYLEVHYLSDVLAGTALGIAWAAACLSLYEWRPDAVTRALPARARALALRRKRRS